MRTVNSARNIAVGLGGLAVTTLLQFVSRAVFIRTIGLEYLGVNGLFSNVLTLLNIMELGVGSAVVFSLYQPLANGDTQKIRALMRLMKKAYNIIGLCVLALGLALLPALPYLMKGTTDLVNVNLVYVLYVLESAGSYWFFSYKAVIFNADQKRYVTSLVSHSVRITTVIVQIVILVVWRSFLGYVVAGLLSKVVRGLFIALEADRQYPYLKSGPEQQLTKQERKAIFKNVYGLSLNKMCNAVIAGTDNLVISGIIGTVFVALYSNYFLVVGAITNASQMVFSAFTASIGNLHASESKEKNEFIFRCLNFLNFWVYGFCAVSLWILFPPFIELLAGTESLLTPAVTLLIVLNFLTEGLQNAVISYRDACGLFWQGRYRPVASVILNIVISVVLAYQIGIAGVVIGTIASRMLTTWWFEPILVYRNAFGMSPKKYFLRYLRSFLLVVAAGGIAQLIVLGMSENTLLNFVLKAAVCVAVPNLMFWIIFRRSEEYKYIVSAAKQFLKRN